MLEMSFLTLGTEHIQDPYSLRCIPQVHGVATDTLDFVRRILETEINSTLDNPVRNCQGLVPRSSSS